MSKKIHVEIGCAYWELSHVNDANTLCYLVEALPDHCHKLEKQFGLNPSVIIENSAISDQTTERFFYKYSRDKAKSYGIDHAQWLEGTCGFDPMQENDPRGCGDKILKLNLQLYDKIKVKCLTWSDFLKKHNISHIDSLKVDTEGYDLEILKQVDFISLGIRKLQFEYFLVKSRFPEDFKKQLLRLEELGFVVKHQDRQNIFLEKNDS